MSTVDRRWMGSLLVLAASCSASGTSDEALPCRPSGDSPGVQLCEAHRGPTPVAPGGPALEDLNPRLLRRFAPLRANFQVEGSGSAERIDLGRLLYFDARLSRSGTVSCNTCHSLESYGTTTDAKSIGVDGQRGQRNAPSTYHAAGEFAQFWDGRSPNVEDQALEPLFSPTEMGMTPESAVARLSAIPGYVAAFQAAFPQERRPLTAQNLGMALGSFERGLVTPGRWDQYLRGDRAALTELEKEGLRVFTSVGCMVCHTGELVGGSMYEKLGAAQPWPSHDDSGRAALTHNPADELMFKVPSLRNVARTGPYFHDGSAKTLRQAVQMMGTYQLGEDLTPSEVEAVVAWLGALTGTLPTAFIRPPALPADASGTP